MRRFNPMIRFISHSKAIEPVSLSTLASNASLETPFTSNRKLRSKSRELANLLHLPTVSEEPILYYKRIHGQIVVSGLHTDTFLVNVLTHCYSKSGCVDYARLLFDNMPKRNLVSWSTVITMYVQLCRCEEALLTFLEFRRKSLHSPNEFILASVIRGCLQLGASDKGAHSQVHGLVIKIGFTQDVYVGTSLVDLYAKIGGIDEASLVFDELTVKSSVTWTTIVTGYVRSGRSDAALMLFSEMWRVEVVLDKYLISSVLTACSMLRYPAGGEQIHAFVLRRGTEMNVSFLNGLLDLHLKCGKVRSGRKLFDHMVTKNVITWTTMISGYMQNSCHADAMELFLKMNSLGWMFDAFTCTSVLTSCGSAEAFQLGRQVHAYTIKANLVESDEFVKTALIDMYCKCDSLVDARKVLDNMIDSSVISHNAMIEGYSRNQQLYEALELFHEMRLKIPPPTPSLLTYVSLLGLSASLFALELSKQIHGLMLKVGISLDIFAASSLIDVYSKCCFLQEARLVFEEVNDKDVVVWNSMFFGYTQQLENEEALKLYTPMQDSGQEPNEFTYVALITAASNLASLRLGQEFHGQLIKKELVSDPFVMNAVVDMYAKCGSLKEARKMFDSTAACLDVTCWNSIISSYAQHGKAEEALRLYDEMLKAGIQPNSVTFVAVLSACSHTGLLDIGLSHFHSMPSFGIQWGTEHYASVVSLLGRAGKLTEAKDFIEKIMPIKPSAIVWRSLLTACRVAGNESLGGYAAQMAISADPEDSGSYILLSNIYAFKGLWPKVKQVRKTMESNGVIKEPGRSWIEVDNKMHVFCPKDKAHYKADAIFSILDVLIRHMEIYYVV